ncbi:hypothetical protein SADUNF_Sadunf08G0079400 [Salix dunnii]|uniref:Uncharacterized protein n=1 Tax=Salix dunnii TaxID=1413687 RepID=A0A835JXV6_9ROSI|nr:hypothetical protein SADUNF_Sadunf08G0079400 [Salix dunnii]
MSPIQGLHILIKAAATVMRAKKKVVATERTAIHQPSIGVSAALMRLDFAELYKVYPLYLETSELVQQLSKPPPRSRDQ